MTSALWSHAEAEAATAGRATAAWTASGVSIDSRSVAPGELFIAIRGDNGDGHRFVGDALAKGAAAAMVAEDWQDVPAEAPLLVVRNTDAGLADLARAARARTAAKIV
ncbi:MAG: Mur ligase domain-containing protein, partial [Alphaproteobacteria bacterium]